MRELVRLAGGCLLAGVLVAGLLSPFVLGGGFAAGRVAATAASISPASLSGDTPLVTTVTDRNGARPSPRSSTSTGCRFPPTRSRPL